MPIGCVNRGGIKPPDPIIDTSTLSITLDNQGMATLQISILTRDKDPITNPCYTFDLNNAIFKGFIQSDNPKLLEGTEYYEHLLIARGMIC